jgi:hypothetical protein
MMWQYKGVTIVCFHPKLLMSKFENHNFIKWTHSSIVFISFIILNNFKLNGDWWNMMTRKKIMIKDDLRQYGVIKLQYFNLWIWAMTLLSKLTIFLSKIFIMKLDPFFVPFAKCVLGYPCSFWCLRNHAHHSWVTYCRFLLAWPHDK